MPSTATSEENNACPSDNPFALRNRTPAGVTGHFSRFDNTVQPDFD